MNEVQTRRKPATAKQVHNDEGEGPADSRPPCPVSDVSEPEEQDVNDIHDDDEDTASDLGAPPAPPYELLMGEIMREFLAIRDAGRKRGYLGSLTIEEKRGLLRSLKRGGELQQLDAGSKTELESVAGSDSAEASDQDGDNEEEEDGAGAADEDEAEPPPEPVRDAEPAPLRTTAPPATREALPWLPYRTHNLHALMGNSLPSGVYNRAPLLTPLQSVATTTTFEDSESEVLSEAAAYVKRGRERRRVVEKARERGGVVGLRDEITSLEFLCPHCLRDDFDDSGRPLAVYSCCGRRAHYSCVVRNHCSDAMGRRDMVACIQCMRPADLPSHETILEYYAEQEAQRRQRQGEGGGGGGERGAGVLWDAYEALAERLKRRKVVEHLREFLRTEDRSAPPEIDVEAALEKGLKIHDMLQAGWSLETVVEQLGLTSLDDNTWARLEFTRTVLLGLGVADLLFFMRRFEVHPYDLRRRFDIRLHHLWRSAERRKARGGAGRRSSSSGGGSRQSRSPGVPAEEYGVDPATGGLASAVADQLVREQRAAGVRSTAAAGGLRARGLATTEALCDRFQSLSPRKLAIMGFDLHHMITMDSGFVKTLFRNFHLFTMRDWVEHLGFRRPHWTILQLDPRDFTSPHGVFRCLDPQGVLGWRLEVLMNQYWNVSPDDLRDMGIVTAHHIASMLAAPLPSSTPPSFHHSAPPPPHPHPYTDMMSPRRRPSAQQRLEPSYDSNRARPPSMRRTLGSPYPRSGMAHPVPAYAPPGYHISGSDMLPLPPPTPPQSSPVVMMRGRTPSRPRVRRGLGRPPNPRDYRTPPRRPRYPPRLVTPPPRTLGRQPAPSAIDKEYGV